MVVYLDQNKWIELARAVNGVDPSPRASQIRHNFVSALERGHVFPMSAVHLMEFSRIKDSGRRSRLGRVMWDVSKGATTAPLNEMLCWELEVAFSKAGYRVIPREFKYIGRGIPHAFGEKLESHIEEQFSDEIDEAMLCGTTSIPPIHGASSQQRQNFANHLRSLHENKNELEPSKWENWLYAMSMMDITEPLHEVMSKHRIPKSDLQSWGVDRLMKFMDSVPTRKLDIQLHRQVLNNPQYNVKESDLEDWAGLGPAMCYADAVVCENHFADMVRRDGFDTHARVETDLLDISRNVGS